MDMTREIELEYAADKIIRETRAYEGDYPAYSERDLARKVEQHREITEADLIEDAVKMEDEDNYKYLNTPIEVGEPLYDTDNPIDAEFRIKPGYELLLLALTHRSGLTSRQRTIIKFTLAGLSLRRIEEVSGIAKSTAGRELRIGMNLIKIRCEELEKYYNLELTAMLLDIQRDCYGGVLNEALFEDSPYGQQDNHLPPSRIKPPLFFPMKRRRSNLNSIKRLSHKLPKNEYTNRYQSRKKVGAIQK